MEEFSVQFIGRYEIDVVKPSTGQRWHFIVAAKGPGRRRLDGPIGMTAAPLEHGRLMVAVLEFAHAEALKAGRIDF